MRKILVYIIAVFGTAYGTSAQDQTINGTTFKQDGKVGVGTTSPTDKLQIYDDVDGSVYLGIYNNSTASNSVAGIKLGMGNEYDIGTYLYHRKYDNTFYFENIGAPSSKFAFVTRKSNGTYSTSLTLNENGQLYQRGDIPNDNNALFINTATSGYGFYSKGGLNNHYAFHFENQAGQSIMLGRGNGNVGIGTTAPDSKLTVKGNIHAEEVKVDLLVPAPDYVFKADYNLRTLEETQNYINEHGHLPNIPSAKEMKENGIELGEMNMKLLEKIEELTLYILSQEKKLQAYQNLEFRINRLENKN